MHVTEVLQNPAYPDSIKQKILLVQQIKKFAEDSLGLKKTNNYSTFFDLKAKPILWITTACPVFSLAPYQWQYPFFGNASYKGFFDIEDAKKEAQTLKNKGLNVKISEVEGWSTLGILPDPILSTMLNRSEGELANLIIHELTHSTLYLKNQVELNENFATFIGYQGARKYLQVKFGKNSKQLIEYENVYADRELFIRQLFKGASQLDSLYKSFNSKQSISERCALKYKQIYQILQSFSSINFHNKKRFSRLSRITKLPNNTFFSDYRVYHQRQDNFTSLFQKQFNENIPKFIHYIKEQNQ